MSLFSRFFLALLISALLPVLAATAWFLRSTERTEANARRFHGQLTGHAVDAVERDINRLNRALAFIEDLNILNTSDLHDLKVLQRAAITHPSFLLLSVLDSSGRETARISDDILFPSGRADEASRHPLVAESRKTGRLSTSGVWLAQKTPVLSVAYPLLKGRVLYAVFSLKGLWKLLKSFQVGTSGRVVLLDDEGRPLPLIAEEFPPPEWDGPLPLTEKSGWLDRVRTARGTMVGAYTRSPSMPWWVLSLQPRGEAFAVGERFLVEAVSCLAVMIVLVSLGTYWLTGKLTSPLQQLIAGARRASRGKFDEPVPDLGWGELSLLSKSFNDMMGELKVFRDLHVERVFQEKAKVDALVHTIPDGIILSSFDGKLLYVNSAARSLLGAPGDTMPRLKTINDVVREPKLRELALSLLHKRKSSGDTEVALPGPQERSYVYFCRAVTVKHEHKEVGVLLIMRDVTTERELDRMKEEFLHSVVHDLRGPIGTIDGFVQVMGLRSDLSEREKTYVGFVHSSCERLRMLVDDILDTAKIESGTLKLKIAPFDAAALVAQMRSIFSIQAKAKKVELDFRRGEDPAEPLQCDQHFMERVAMNLLGNALKFTPQGGRITLAIGASGAREMEFSVEDTGPGIAPDQLAMVFEKFKQLDKGIEERSGFGLGLSICKKVVELHGGRIWAESEAGKGARFVFRLPLKPPALSRSAST